MEFFSEVPKKKKGCYASEAQIRRLIELLDADPQLRSGKFSANFSQKIAQKRWCAISDDVNAIGGAHKTWSEWRKCYQDKKAKTKKKAAALNRSANRTGGGGPEKELDDDEKFLLNTISSAAVSGHSDSNESRVVFMDLTNSTTSSTSGEQVTTNNYYQICKDVTENATENATENVTKDVIEDVTEDVIEDVTEEISVEIIETGTTPRNIAPNKKSLLRKSQETATALQETLQDKNNIKKEYYKKKLELLNRQTIALEAKNDILLRQTNAIESIARGFRDFLGHQINDP